MKIFKNLLCVLIATVSLAFCANVARASIGIVTNYDTLTFSATIVTNRSFAAEIPGGGYKAVLGPEKCVTKDLINLLTNEDFANSSFPANSKLVVGWDQGWNGDVLVVDSTGTNVIFDATYNNGNSNNATFYANFFYRKGAVKGTDHRIGNGNFIITAFDTGYFIVKDEGLDIYLEGFGPCTAHFTSIGSTSAWSDSQSFTTYGESINAFGHYGPIIGTLNGKLTASGRGKGFPTYWEYYGLQYP